MKLDVIERERTVKLICSELNQFTDLKSVLNSILKKIKELTNVESVGIRLYNNGDYPYYIYNGFPESFIKKENYLCAKNKNGNKISDPDRKGWLLDCMCGNIIKGKFDPSLEFFTAKGSFWSNNTTALLASTTEEERQSSTRNYCNSCGYESVALIPIKNKEGIIGLIQLNDKRAGMYSEELIEYIEMIGEQIGIAIENSTIYEQLLKQKTELENTLDELHETQNYLIEAKKMASLGNLVAGIAHEMNTPIGNAINATHIIIDESSKINENNDFSNIDAVDFRNFIQTNDELSKILLSNLQKVRDLIQSFKNSAVNNSQEKTRVLKIKPFLRDLIKSINPTLKDKNIKFEFDHNSDLTITTKPDLLFQIFSNLIMNSYMHGFENRKEGIIQIDYQKTNKRIVFRYKDNGIGIPSEISTRIFDPFFTTKKSTNTGIGLHIVYNTIANKLNGQIDFESKQGKGSLFIISLPLI